MKNMYYIMFNKCHVGKKIRKHVCEKVRLKLEILEIHEMRHKIQQIR